MRQTKVLLSLREMHAISRKFREILGYFGNASDKSKFFYEVWEITAMPRFKLLRSLPNSSIGAKRYFFQNKADIKLEIFFICQLYNTLHSLRRQLVHPKTNIMRAVIKFKKMNKKIVNVISASFLCFPRTILVSLGEGEVFSFMRDFFSGQPVIDFFSRIIRIDFQKIT